MQGTPEDNSVPSRDSSSRLTQIGHLWDRTTLTSAVSKLMVCLWLLYQTMSQKPDLAVLTGRSLLPDASSYRVSEHQTVCNFRDTLDSGLCTSVLLPISMERSCPSFPPRTATHPSGSQRPSPSAALSSTMLSSVPVFALLHHFGRIGLGC